MRLPTLTTTTTTLLALLPSLLAAGTNFQFTAPSTSAPLNLSSPSIPINWTVPAGSSDLAYDRLSLWFSSEADGFGYELAANLTLAAGDGGYDWDPKNVTDALAGTNVTLASGKAQYLFEARLRTAEGAQGATVDSDMFSVVGYRFMSGASGVVARSGWWVFGVVAGVGVLVL